MSSIDEIKARIDIIDLVSETVQLRRSGKNYTGFCPFHSNSRTPAFVVFPETGTWRCFGQCNEGGDIFGFVMKKEGWDFSDALHFLAEKAGVQLKPPSTQDLAAAEEHDNLRSLLEEAVTFYRHQLMQTSAGQPALAYLRQRGLKDETIEAFGLGYALASRDAALKHFKSKGASEQSLLDAGLLSERQEGGLYDRFRHRIMFPIRDERGRMAGFGARILDPQDVPKFLNSPQTAVFDKGRLLYGLDRARKAIRDGEQAVMVEGYLDVVALHQAGYSNAVSPMGTALTEHQLYLLKRLARRIILALDSDAAGEKATLRGLQIARQSLDRQTELVFDARGLLNFEARLQTDLRVAALPPGLDPDDLVNQDPEAWRRLIGQAKPVVMHVMDVLAAGHDTADPRVKSEIAAQVLPLIADVPSEIERDTYRQRLARLLKIDERILVNTAPAPAVRRFSRRGAAGPPPGQPQTGAEKPPAPAGGIYGREAHILGVLLRLPDILYKVDRHLQQAGLSRLVQDDFQAADHQTILQLLQDSIDQDVAEPLDYVMNHLSLPMMEVADSLLARTEKLNPNEEAVLSDVLRNLLLLRLQSVNQNIEYVRFLIEEAQNQGDLKAEHFQKLSQQNAAIRYRLDQALGKYTSHDIPSRTGVR
jgi:DNA primase